MFGELNHTEIEELLNKQLIGRLGCHAEGLTYIVPISYAYDGSYFYCHTTEGLKLQLMRKNPQVCFQTDAMSQMDAWQSVVAWGEFEELTEPVLREEALQKLVDRNLPLVSSETVHLSPDWPFVPKELNNIEGVVFRIKITRKTGRFEKSASGQYFAT